MLFCSGYKNSFIDYRQPKQTKKTLQFAIPCTLHKDDDPTSHLKLF